MTIRILRLLGLLGAGLLITGLVRSWPWPPIQCMLLGLLAVFCSVMLIGYETR